MLEFSVHHIFLYILCFSERVIFYFTNHVFYLCTDTVSYKDRFDKHQIIYEPRHNISNNVLCATSKGSDPPAHMRSLIRAFASCLNIL